MIFWTVGVALENWRESDFVYFAPVDVCRIRSSDVRNGIYIQDYKRATQESYCAPERTRLARPITIK